MFTMEHSSTLAILSWLDGNFAIVYKSKKKGFNFMSRLILHDWRFINLNKWVKENRICCGDTPDFLMELAVSIRRKKRKYWTFFLKKNKIKQDLFFLYFKKFYCIFGIIWFFYPANQLITSHQPNFAYNVPICLHSLSIF